MEQLQDPLTHIAVSLRRFEEEDDAADPPARRDLLQQADVHASRLPTAIPLSKDSLAACRLESLPRLAFFALDPWHPAGFLVSETS